MLISFSSNQPALAALAIPRNNSSRRLIQIRLKLIMMQFYTSANLPKDAAKVPRCVPFIQ